ncbi:glycosyltransferase [Streptococcus sanguinis]|uniref:Probable glycosyl transferase n=1 Tax=Streptococcus sanguinis TaxID=1305 RepID=A0A0B7GPU3_STRSA|nr:probable glycosyl transferase [Streptococcus sanguinis]
MNQKKSVILAGDYGYIRQIETTIKSLCCYHEDLAIYVFNQDIPQEWFINIRRKVKGTGNDLVDIKLLRDDFRQNWEESTYHHINYMAYARYFIPEYVKTDRSLYLDCDLIVTQNLDHLFELDLEDYYIAAVRATFGLGIGFNSGVMLINNKRWREENISQQLVELTDREIPTVLEGDQSILNMLFGDQYLKLEDNYNFQIGFDMGASQYGHDFVFDIPLSPLPAIVHYISALKPWNLLTNMRLRELWWFYNDLEWSSIISSKDIKGLSNHDRGLGQVYNKELLTLTNSDSLEKIEELVQALPDCLFHIAAYSDMSDRLVSLLRYENVRLHRLVLPILLKRLMESCDIYLDINHGNKFQDFLEMVEQKGKPIFAFDSTKTEGISERVFASNSYQEMVEAIRAYSD